MITEIAIYYDCFPTNTLETILQNDLRHGDASALSTEAVLHICEILWKRRMIVDPEFETRKKEFWKRLQDQYFNAEDDPDP